MTDATLTPIEIGLTAAIVTVPLTDEGGVFVDMVVPLTRS